MQHHLLFHVVILLSILILPGCFTAGTSADPADAARILEKAYSRLTRNHGFHMVTLQLETDCLDERHAQDLDVTRDPSSDTLDKDARAAKIDHNMKGGHH